MILQKSFSYADLLLSNFQKNIVNIYEKSCKIHIFVETQNNCFK